VHYPLPGLRRIADIAFPRLRVAVFIDGCFWHGCPEHGTWPKQNADWWCEKIEANQRRDADTDRRLAEQGWTSIRVWEHERPTDAVAKIERVIADTKQRRPASQ
jgi:DNA mismatch endonuclease (patch repair protein)